MKRTSLYFFVCCVLLCCAPLHLGAQHVHFLFAPEIDKMRDSLRTGKPDTTRLRQLVWMAAHYERREGNFPSDIDSCILLLDQALELSNVLHNEYWRNEALLLKGKTLLEINDPQNGNACYMQVINYYLKNGEKHKAAEIWEEFVSSSTVTEDQLNGCLQARPLYLAAGDTIAAILAFKRYADLHMNLGQLDLAEKEFLEILADLKRLHYPKLYDTYYLLSAVNRLKGNKQMELYYILETIKGV